MRRTAVLFLVMVGLFVVGAARIVAAKELDEQVSLSGQLHVIWGDSSDDAAGSQETVRFGLVGEDGSWVELDVADVSGGDVLSLNRQHVVLEGQWQNNPQASVLNGSDTQNSLSASVFRVMSIRRDAENGPFALQFAEEMMPMAAAVVGTQQWVTILCRFADVADTPRERGWFEALMLGNNYPSMNHYWRELSFGQVDLTGSQVAGWYNLPRPRSYYVYDMNGDGREDLDFGRAAQDCATVADAEVYFPGFGVVNFVFNKNIGGAAWGGSWTLSLDGQQRSYGATWIRAHSSVGQDAWGHETGHALGLTHSSGQYDRTYDSPWDVMSNSIGCIFDLHPVFGCVGQHTIGWHKERLGWIPSDRIYIAGPGSSQTVEIKHLENWGDGSGYLMARIPVNGSGTVFYTVEVRQRIGYDKALPSGSTEVIIHRVDTDRWDRQAQVVDADGNGNPGDAGAMWIVGETFATDNGIKVFVVGETADGFMVLIENGGSQPPPSTFTLTVTKGGGGVVAAPGIDCGGDCLEQFSDGIVVTLSAYPDAGWAFAGWSGDADCNDGQVAMSRDIACHAEFSPVPPEPRPNLLGWFSSLAKKVKKGSERVSFTFFAHNNGVQPVYGSFTVAFYISDDAILDGSDVFLTTKWTSNKKGLAPGGALKIKGKKIVLPIPGSGKYLLAVLDPWSEVPESNEQDNVVAIPIP